MGVALVPALGVAALTVVISATALLEAPEVGEMAVVFPPWTTSAQIRSAIVDAGGQVAGTSRIGGIVVALSPDSRFKQRLHDRGALLFLSATVLCGAVADIVPGGIT